MLSLNDEQLMAINLQMAKSQPVLNEVIAQLGRKVSPDSIDVSSLPNTLIIQIKVEDPDPQDAATIANLIVETLIKQNETLLSGWYSATEKSLTEQLVQVQAQIDVLQTQISQNAETSIQGQLAQVNLQIDELKGEITALEKEVDSFPDNLTPLDAALVAEKQAQLERLNSLMSLYQQIQANLTFIGKPSSGGQGLENPQLATLQTTLNLYRQINTNLLNSRETVRLARAQSRQVVLQIVPATAPKNQVRPVPNLYLLMGCLVGLALAATGVLIADHFDDTLKTAAQTEKMLGLPVLGFVYENKRTIALDDPFSTEADAFRTLGAGLEIIGAGRNYGAFMLVNARPSDARVTVAANWAVVHARQGRRVILLDGDLKRPHLHRLFGVENKNGLSDYLKNGLEWRETLHPAPGVDGLTLIPAGNAGEDGTAWMDSSQCKSLLHGLQQLGGLLIVDGPSSDAADALVLAAEAGAVIFTVEAGRVPVEAAKTALQRLRLIGANVVGAVLVMAPKGWTLKRQLLTLLKNKMQKKESAYEVKSGTDDVSVSPSV
jgi:capsular polysaccharide biosynthesis protein/MinD-like ATPase involved in chromosome partitioning or flagellar assembly